LYLIVFGVIILGILFLLGYSNLSQMWLSGQELIVFQENFRFYTLVVAGVFVLIVVLNFWLKDKYEEWSETESLNTKIVESHTLFPKIREYARDYYSLQLGKCLRIQGLTPHKEAGSIPPTRFFLFENLEYGCVVSYSIWVVNYVKKVNIHLYKREWFGRDSGDKYWTGESRVESSRKLVDTSAGLKEKDTKHFKDGNENSATIEN